MPKLKPIIFIIIFLVLILAPPALAQKQVQLGVLQGLGIELSQRQTPAMIVGMAANGILMIFGAFALFFIVYGGIIILTSAGNQQNVSKGKNILTWATIGIAIILTSFVTVNYIIGSATGIFATFTPKPPEAVPPPKEEPPQPEEPKKGCANQGGVCVAEKAGDIAICAEDYKIEDTTNECADDTPVCCFSCTSLNGACEKNDGTNFTANKCDPVWDTAPILNCDQASEKCCVIKPEPKDVCKNAGGVCVKDATVCPETYQKAKDEETECTGDTPVCCTPCTSTNSGNGICKPEADFKGCTPDLTQAPPVLNCDTTNNEKCCIKYTAPASCTGKGGVCATQADCGSYVLTNELTDCPAEKPVCCKKCASAQLPGSRCIAKTDPKFSNCTPDVNASPSNCVNANEKCCLKYINPTGCLPAYPEAGGCCKNFSTYPGSSTTCDSSGTECCDCGHSYESEGFQCEKHNYTTSQITTKCPIISTYPVPQYKCTFGIVIKGHCGSGLWWCTKPK